MIGSSCMDGINNEVTKNYILEYNSNNSDICLLTYGSAQHLSGRIQDMQSVVQRW